MGKYDGMDPKLVRDLLGEAKRAAEELRRVEGRVGQIMTGVGLATQTTHRPVQVADEADKMVKDVTARLAVLEKRAGERDGTRPATDDDPNRNGYDPPPTGEGKPDGKTDEGKPDGTPCDDGVQDRGIIDTPAKDHPDDRDPSKPQVIEVDGVKVIQVPLNPPTASQLESLLDNLDRAQPIDMPQVDTRPGQADGYADRPSGSDQPIRNDPPTGAAPPSATESPATQPPGADGCSDNGSGRDSEASRETQPRDQDVRDSRQDGNPRQDGDSRQDSPRQDVPRQGNVGEVPRDDGTGLVVPPTPPPDTTSGTQPVGTQSPGTPAYDRTGADAVTGSPAGVSAWAVDGGDVVAVNADVPGEEAIRLLIGDAEDVQLMEAPQGDRGVWLPEDIEPDGPRGSADRGTPERSA